jgi:hypothetical protein
MENHDAPLLAIAATFTGTPSALSALRTGHASLLGRRSKIGMPIVASRRTRVAAERGRSR